MAVDYMTRFMLGAPAEEAFKISMMGAKLIKEEMKAQKLMAGIQGLDKNSIVNAVKLSGFDVCYRAGVMGYRPVDEILPDAATVENISNLLEDYKESTEFAKTDIHPYKYKRSIFDDLKREGNDL